MIRRKFWKIPGWKRRCNGCAGWIELDTKSVEEAHETMADLGLENLSAMPQRVGLEQAAHFDEQNLARFADSVEAKELRQRLANFEGIPKVILPAGVQAELRP